MGLQKILTQGNVRGAISVSIYFISVLFSLFVQIKFLEKSSFKKYGLHINKVWLQEFGVGCVLSLIQLCLFFVIVYLTGNVEITGYFIKSSPDYSFAQGFLSQAFSLLAGSSAEELFFRAFLFYIFYEALQTTVKDTNRRVAFAVCMASVLFGFAHFQNNGATTISNLNLVFDGLMISLPFLITGRLGMSIGIHFAWNLIQGSVFGFAISGNIAKATIISVAMPHNLITGGVFGPEGSILLVLLDAIAVVLLLYWKRLKSYENVVNPTVFRSNLTGSM